MLRKPTYKELEQRLMELEKETVEHKRTEEALLESEEKFHLISEQSNLAILILQSGSIVYINQAVAEIIGYSIEDIKNWTGNKIAEVIHPDHLSFIMEQGRKKQKGEKDVIPEYSYQVVTKTGQVRWVKNYSKTILYKGKFADFITLIDITEQKRTEQLLRESEERFRRLSEASFEGIFIHDRGEIIDMNKTLETMLGYKYSEGIGENLISFVAPEYIDLIVQKFRSGYELPYEAACIKEDGSILPIEICAKNAIYDGRTVRVVAIRDITERKRVEKTLQESEERLRAIFEASADPIVVYDNQGYPQYLNPAFTQVFGWTLEELRGRQIPFVPDNEKERTFTGIRELYEKYYGNKEPTRMETRRFTKDGRTLDILLSGSLIEGHEGEPVGMVVNLTDITERKKLETQFQAAQRMEALGTLAGGIAHDFNNLLMAVQGNASLMLIDKDMTHPDYERLKNIEQYVQNGADLTKQLLGFARGGKYDVRPTDINKLIKKTSGMFGRTKKEIRIHGKYQKDIWTVEVDQGQIGQTLLNLFVNAWQAMPGGGELYLETENIILGENSVTLFKVEPGNYVKISISDTGIGMDEVTRQKIFEPFFTTKEMGRGTGLGLASAYGIIKNHGGSINVYSEKGEGTTFNIYLPVSEKKVIEKKETGEVILNDVGTVLLVDDEEMIIDVGKGMLKALGCNVLTAASGKEAIDIYRKDKKKIDMVILDMIMPEMNGGEVYDRLKEINPEIQIILSSGYSINGQAIEILNRGCNGFIQKPFDMKELSQKLKELLNKMYSCS
ncbi:MAG: PAS domain S-box protein [Thermodesulfobacteriota bacterium]|nr:PAS domain S-box protein [Thermodesulfobacteriota bacterium]